MNYLNKKKIKTECKKFNAWFFAISIAISSYALLFLLFTSAKIKNTNSKVHQRQIIMLPLGSNNNQQTQKQLLYWLKDDNPTLIVQPNNKYGYSSILNQDFNLTVDKTSFDINSILTPLYFFYTSFKIHPISVRMFTPKQLFSRLDLIDNPSVPTIPFLCPSTTKLDYPYVKDYYSGTQIPVKFSKKKKIQELIRKYAPKKPTILIINTPANPLFFPTVNIISSCDFPELDNEAINTLTTASLSKDKLLQGKQIKVYVEWKKLANVQHPTSNQHPATLKL